MIDITSVFPKGCTDYTVIDVSETRSNNREMLRWLREFDHDSWFAWERPDNKVIFEKEDIAVLFTLRWL
jgi:hypothetical protein